MTAIDNYQYVSLFIRSRRILRINNLFLNRPWIISKVFIDVIVAWKYFARVKTFCSSTKNKNHFPRRERPPYFLSLFYFCVRLVWYPWQRKVAPERAWWFLPKLPTFQVKDGGARSSPPFKAYPQSRRQLVAIVGANRGTRSKPRSEIVEHCSFDRGGHSLAF